MTRLLVLVVLIALFVLHRGEQQSKSGLLRRTKMNQQLVPSSNSALVESATSTSPAKRDWGETAPTPARSSSSRQAQPLYTLQAAMRNVQDEVLDVYDALVHAQNNEERLEELIYILDRHKLLLSGAAAATIIKSRLGSKSATRLGMDAIGQLRRAEMAKWGARS